MIMEENAPVAIESPHNPSTLICVYLRLSADFPFVPYFARPTTLRNRPSRRGWLE